jgi:hypothetical protein
VDEIKQRYYDVARKLLIHRGENSHKILKYKPFFATHEILRKHNWEKIFSRTKDQVNQELRVLQDHIYLEKQIQQIEA